VDQQQQCETHELEVQVAQLQQELGEVEDFVAFCQRLCRRTPGAWRWNWQKIAMPVTLVW